MQYMGHHIRDTGGQAGRHVCRIFIIVGTDTDTSLEDRTTVNRLLAQATRDLQQERDAEAVAALEGKPLEEIFGKLAPLAGLTGDGLPERMAALNSMLDLLPAAVRDELLTVYVNMTS